MTTMPAAAGSTTTQMSVSLVRNIYTENRLAGKEVLFFFTCKPMLSSKLVGISVTDTEEFATEHRLAREDVLFVISTTSTHILNHL